MNRERIETLLTEKLALALYEQVGYQALAEEKDRALETARKELAQIRAILASDEKLTALYQKTKEAQEKKEKGGATPPPVGIKEGDNE